MDPCLPAHMQLVAHQGEVSDPGGEVWRPMFELLGNHRGQTADVIRQTQPTATNGATSSAATSSAINVAARVRLPPRRRTPHRNAGQVTKHRITAHSNTDINGYSTTMQPAVRRIAMAIATIRSIRCVLFM